MTETDLQIENAEDQRIVDALPLPAMVLSGGLLILCANAAAEKLFERKLKGQSLIRIARQPALLACIEDAQGSGGLITSEMTMKIPSLRTFQISAAPLGSAKDERLLFTLLDISAELDAEKSRSTFVANVSHELRSPLTSLMGVVETLKGPARDDLAARDRFLDLMQGETERMSRLVGDLLSLAKLEAKEHILPDAQVDIAATLQRVITMLTESSPSNKGRLRLKSLDGPAMIIGDQDELTEVFHNLIENALKYSGQASPVDITLLAQPGKHPRQAGQIVFTVKDYGDGIAPEHIPRLTERFYRVDKGRSREKGGTGLGLAITKHILNRHRTRLQIKSRLGEGTEMQIGFTAKPVA